MDSTQHLASSPIVVAVLIGWLGAAPLASQDPLYPGAEWPESSPESQGFDPDALEDAVALTETGAGHVIRNGQLVYRWGSSIRLWDVKSTAKSIGSILLGLAVDDGLVGLDDPGALHHDEFAILPAENEATGWIDEITLRQLATHTAGFEKPGGYEALVHAPGTEFLYSDCGANWLAECLTLAFRSDLHTVLRQRILSRIGVGTDEIVWRDHSYRDETLGRLPNRELASGIRMTIPALARLGYLFLQRGRWAGEQLLSEAFVDEVTTPDPSLDGIETEHGRPANRYGVLWWTNAHGTMPGVPLDAFWSWGLGEGIILVIPSLDLVVTRAGVGLQDGEWEPDYDVLEPFFTALVASIVESPEPASFRRGDANDDGSFNVTDAVTLLDALFAAAPLPACLDAADANNDEVLDLSDGVTMLLRLFGGRPPLPAPGEPPATCGADPESAGSSRLGCGAYASC